MNQSSNKQSFFDSTPLPAKKIWEKITGDSQYKEFKQLQDKEQILQQDTFYKVCKKQGKKKQRYLILVNDRIYVQKAAKKAKLSGMLSLNDTRCQWIRENNPKNVFSGLSCSYIYGIRLIKNQCISEFYTEDLGQFEKWKSYLFSKVLQTTFHDDFSVSKMIGRGSFAKVYLATKNETQQKYAIKAFNKEFMTSQHKGVDSIRNEIKVMRSLNNPYLIKLYEVYETQNSIYFVVDILSGGELLSDIKSKDQKFTLVNLKTVMFNLLSALEHLHSQGIMHRDLKPENILIRSKGQYDIVVADFGLATTYDKPAEILFKRCGTPGFVAPEILLYDEKDAFYDSKCDIFSAGVIMYMLMTGKQPFQGFDYKQILRANKNCDVSFSSELFQNQHPIAVDLLKKILVAAPEKRLTAQQCLDHGFFQIEDKECAQQGEASGLKSNLDNYQKDFKQDLKKNVFDSKELTGSMALKTVSNSGLNGNVNTIGSLKMNSNGKFDSKNSIDGSGGFKERTREKKVSQFACENGSNNTNGQNQGPKKKPKERHSKNLHKFAIKNSLYRQQQEEMKREEESGDNKDDSDFNDDDYSVSEEDQDNQIANQMKRMNFEQHINMNTLSRSQSIHGDDQDQDDDGEGGRSLFLNENKLIRDKAQSDFKVKSK